MLLMPQQRPHNDESWLRVVRGSVGCGSRCEKEMCSTAQLPREGILRTEMMEMVGMGGWVVGRSFVEAHRARPRGGYGVVRACWRYSRWFELFEPRLWAAVELIG